MVLNISLPDNYGYVALTAMSTGWLLVYQTYVVIRARRGAKVSYPQAYAEAAEAKANPAAMKFNCAQRAHHNTLEVVPHTLFTILFSGLRYPTAATALGTVWVLGRIIYTMGYATGEPAKRTRGEFHALSLLALYGLTTYAAYEMAVGKW